MHSPKEIHEAFEHLIEILQDAGVDAEVISIVESAVEAYDDHLEDDDVDID